MSEVVIRRFCESDLDQLYDMIQKSLSTHLISKVYDKSKVVLMHEFYTKRYIAGASKLKNLYVAVLEDRIVGSVALSPDGSRTYVSMVYIDPDCQGKGIGRKLMKAAEKDELSQQTKELYLSAILSAGKFYQKMGYRFTAEVPEIVVEEGMEFVMMEKHL